MFGPKDKSSEDAFFTESSTPFEEPIIKVNSLLFKDTSSIFFAKSSLERVFPFLSSKIMYPFDFDIFPSENSIQNLRQNALINLHGFLHEKHVGMRAY